ncbi:MAG: S9 family peptidase [Lewinellaceae bacterium]|nr:S9 family peptidase [Lewinellaceae bacterium]
MIRLIFVLVLGSLTGLLSAQRIASVQPITLEGIWQEGIYDAKSVPGFNFQRDGRHYTRLEGNRIIQYDLTTGQQTAVILDAATLRGQAGFSGELDGYTFSADERKLLLEVGKESIYRRSSQAHFLVFDRNSGQLEAVFPGGKIMYASFNPQADKVAFVYQNNLYYRDLASGQITAITTDGARNAIINGAADWVYEEEFSMAQAFSWSGDGNKIGFLRFDERAVPEFTMTLFKKELYPEYVTFKYPKVGEPNSLVGVRIFDLTTAKTVAVNTGTETDQYIPRIKWTSGNTQLCLTRLNRHQNELELLLADATTGDTRRLLRETNPAYIDLHDNLTFLANGQEFLWTSEADGWNHLYLYDMNGKLVRQLTKGNWEVTDFYGVDEANGVLYYQAAENSPLERQVYQLGLNGRNKVELAEEPGWNIAQFSSTFDYFVLNHSTANRPSSYVVYDRKGSMVRTIEENTALIDLQQKAAVSPVEFFKFKTSEQVELNGWMIKPANFNPNARYPVFMFLYGGPGSQQVTDSWKGANYWWFEMLAQQGYLVACVDNRGTGGRGEQFKKITYQQLGKYETIDQLEAARYLAGLTFTDPQRIGIFGWSYGGYMSSLCLLKGNDIFKVGIAVAPVTNWKWYDSIYTERYMRTEAENPGGYRDNSPVNFADRLQGKYLLVHGLADDNVHFQHTAEMTNALVAANKQFDTYVYPNRNHGIRGDNARLHLYTKMTNFLHENLRGRPLAESTSARDQGKVEMMRKLQESKVKKNIPIKE